MKPKSSDKRAGLERVDLRAGRARGWRSRPAGQAWPPIGRGGPSATRPAIARLRPAPPRGSMAPLRVALSHKKIASFYLQLAQQLDAGFTLAAALRSSGGAPLAGTEAMARWIEAGGSLDHAMTKAEDWLPKSDRPFLSAAALSGRLPLTLRNLAARHTQISATQAGLALACAYPVVILHLALLIFPVMRMIDWGKGLQWSTTGYLGTLAVTILPLWGAAWWIFVLARRESPVLGRVLDLMPGIRGYRKAQALAEFTFTLSNLLDAGVLIAQAWAVAGAAARSAALRQAGLAMHDTIMQGEPPGLHLADHACFPTDYVAFYRAGELSGQLDQNLKTLATQSADRAQTILKITAGVYAGGVFLLVAAMVLYFVFSFYSGYFNMFDKFSQ